MSPRWISPLRYPGGKARMGPWLTDVFAAVDGPMDTEVWIEPFGGGAGAALMALYDGHVPEAWIVESHPGLAAFWDAVMHDEGQLAARVETTVPTLVAFDAAREIVTAAMTEQVPDRAELAYAAFLLNRCSRSGMVAPSVGPIGGRAQTGRYTVASRFNGPALAERLRRIAAFGDRFLPSEGDGIASVEALAGSGIADEVFLFVDPPYIGVGNRLYWQGMDAAAHTRLAAALRACPSPWVLTYDAHPTVRDLYPKHRIMEFEMPYAAAGARTATEYLVLAPEVVTPPGSPLGRGAVAERPRALARPQESVSHIATTMYV